MTNQTVYLFQIDRLHEWKSTPNGAIEVCERWMDGWMDGWVGALVSDWLAAQKCIKKQGKMTMQEFDTRVQQVKVQLAEQGFNSELYYINKVCLSVRI